MYGISTDLICKIRIRVEAHVDIVMTRTKHGVNRIITCIMMNMSWKKRKNLTIIYEYFVVFFRRFYNIVCRVILVEIRSAMWHWNYKFA
jgi:hypothetical protein